MAQPNFVSKMLRSLAAILSIAVAGCVVSSSTCAQDVDAVERRLGSAIAAGEITFEQAQVMLEALRRTSHRHESSREHGHEHEHEHGHEHGHERESQKPARTDAKQRPVSVRDRVGQLSQQRGHALESAEAKKLEARRRRLTAAKQRLEVAVKEGKMSPKEAKAKFEELEAQAKASIAGPRKNVRADLEADLREIRAAFNAGKLTREEAEKKLRVSREKMAAEKR